MILDKEPDNVGGLGHHGNIIQIVSCRKSDEQVRGNHHGNISHVHLVRGGVLSNLLKELQ